MDEFLTPIVEAQASRRIPSRSRPHWTPFSRSWSWRT